MDEAIVWMFLMEFATRRIFGYFDFYCFFLLLQKKGRLKGADRPLTCRHDSDTPDILLAWLHFRFLKLFYWICAVLMVRGRRRQTLQVVKWQGGVKIAVPMREERL